MKYIALGEILVVNIVQGLVTNIALISLRVPSWLHLVLHLSVDSHLELYIPYKLAAVL